MNWPVSFHLQNCAWFCPCWCVIVLYRAVHLLWDMKYMIMIVCWHLKVVCAKCVVAVFFLWCPYHCLFMSFNLSTLSLATSLKVGCCCCWHRISGCVPSSASCSQISLLWGFMKHWPHGGVGECWCPGLDFKNSFHNQILLHRLVLYQLLPCLLGSEKHNSLVVWGAIMILCNVSSFVFPWPW